MIEKLLMEILIIIIIVVSLMYYKRRRDLFSPGFIMIGFWSVMLFATLILDDGVNGYIGYLWIIVAIIIYALGYNLGIHVKVSGRIFAGAVSMNKRLMRKTILVLGSILIVYYGIEFIKNGGIANTAENAYEHYTNEMGLTFSERVLNQILSMLMYALPFVGGQYFNCETDTRRKSLTIIVFIPGLLSLLVSSMKLGFVTSIMLFAIGYITASLYSKNHINVKFYVDLFKKYWKLIVGFVILMIFALTIRMGTINQYYVMIAANKFLSYAFGSPAAFNFWLSSYEGNELEYGTNTFMGMFNAFGIVNRENGVYKEVFTSTTLGTNVYTAYRGVILDFGVWGGLFFVLMLGILAGMAMNRYRKTASIGSFIILSMSYLFIFYSLFVSPYTYVNMTILFPIIAIGDYISSRVRFSRRNVRYEG